MDEGLLKRLCRDLAPEIAEPPPRPRSRGEQSEKLMFSCSNLNPRFYVRIDGIQALNSATEPSAAAEIKNPP